MEKPIITVVIPTYNRASALRETLIALNRQSLAPDLFQVIVVDDGSTDGTQAVVTTLEVPYRYYFLQQENRGAAAARNLGAAQAATDILLFLDADMIAHPKLVEEHLKSHRLCSQVLITGRRKPWPAARTSLYSQILDLDSNVSERSNGGAISFQEAFTCNLSVKKVQFEQIEGFDEDFPRYHDVEFAYRATQIGLEVIFNPEAIAYHNHPMTLKQYCQKVRWCQESAAQLIIKYPKLRGQIAHLRDKEPISWRQDPLPLIARKVARRLLALPPVLASMHGAVDLLERYWPSPRLLRFLYWKILGSYQWRGFQEGIKRYGW